MILKYQRERCNINHHGKPIGRFSTHNLRRKIFWTYVAYSISKLGASRCKRALVSKSRLLCVIMVLSTRSTTSRARRPPSLNSNGYNCEIVPARKLRMVMDWICIANTSANPRDRGISKIFNFVNPFFRSILLNSPKAVV